MGDAEPNATEAFESVTNPTRVEILRALRDAYSESPTDPWVAYSDLKAAVGVRDNGKFNYHLDRLGDLVVKDAAGYRLSRTGMAVVSTVSAGDFDAGWTWGPVDAPGDCHVCGDSLQLRYEDGILWLTCGTEDHDRSLSVSPALLDSHPDEAVVERVAFLESRWGAMTRQGICSECQGRVEGEFRRFDDGGESSAYDYHGDCRQCGFQHVVPAGLLVFTHPAVVAFYHDHGVDVRTTPFWTFAFTRTGAETVESTDPLRLRVDAARDGERLSLTLDREGAVVSTERSTLAEADAA